MGWVKLIGECAKGGESVNYRTLGRTGIEISEIAFGGGRSGGILIYGDDATRRAAVRRALDLGINWFDTAPQYGQGKSEQAMGWLLEEIGDTPYLSTKVMVKEEELDDIAGAIERSMSESLTRLRRDSVDLLQLHNKIAPQAGGRALGIEHVLGPGGVADGLERLRDQGLTRFIGLTALGDAAATCRVLASGRFDTAQVYYNVLNPSAGQTMPAAWTGFDGSGIVATCREHDVGIMAIRVFAASYIATPVRTGRESILTADTTAENEVRMAEAVFAELGTDYGSRAQTAVRFALANGDISTVIIGLSEIAHLDQAAAAMEMGALPADARARLDALYETDFGRV